MELAYRPKKFTQLMKYCLGGRPGLRLRGTAFFGQKWTPFHICFLKITASKTPVATSPVRQVLILAPSFEQSWSVGREP